MGNEAKKWFTIISIAIAVLVIVLLLLAEFDISGFEIHKGIKIG